MNILKWLFDRNKITKNVTESGGVYWTNYKGQLHRIDGPAIESHDGIKEWYRNGKIHRTDGPAIEYPTGDKVWVQNGKHHRKDGPAIECSDGIKFWYLNGEEVTEQDVMGDSVP